MLLKLLLRKHNQMIYILLLEMNVISRELDLLNKFYRIKLSNIFFYKIVIIIIIETIYLKKLRKKNNKKFNES